MAKDQSLLGGLTDQLTNLVNWLVNRLPEVAFDTATWLFRGSPDDVVLKLMAALLVLTCLFTYAFRPSFSEFSRPVNTLIVLLGVVFWGTALLAGIVLIDRW